MQFPVPQFTDVEDKIIAGLTIKQFGILFGVGVIVFLAFSASKSVIVLIIFFLLFGLPGLMVAFYKPNGRPLYNSFGMFLKFFTSPKVLVFHKEVNTMSSSVGLKSMDVSDKTKVIKAEPMTDPRERLREVNAILIKQAEEEVALSKKIH